MVDLTKYWVMASVVSKIFATPDGQTLWEWQLNAPTAGVNGAQAVFVKEVDHTGDWWATWYLAIDPQLGVVEFRDSYPDGGNYVFVPGQQVRWGTSSMKVGDMLQGSVQADCTKSVGIPCGSAIGWGYFYTQLAAMLPQVTVEAGTYYNVAQIEWYQTWCADATCTKKNQASGTYYLAEGIGIIGVDIGGVPQYRLAAVVTTKQ